MKRFTAFLSAGFITAGLSVLGVNAYAHEGHDHKAGSDDKLVTVQGELIDTACFVASDGDAKGKDHAACAAKCMASGVPAAILPDGKKAGDMMYLLTNPTVLSQYAGKMIKVEGTAHEDMKAIDVKKLSVQDGTGWKEVQLNDEHHKMGGGSDAKEKAEHAGHDHADHK